MTYITPVSDNTRTKLRGKNEVSLIPTHNQSSASCRRTGEWNAVQLFANENDQYLRWHAATGPKRETEDLNFSCINSGHLNYIYISTYVT